MDYDNEEISDSKKEETVIQPHLRVRQITESVDMDVITKNSMMSCDDMN